MYHLIVELERGEEVFDDEFLDVPAGFTELAAADRQWRKDHFEAYRRTRDARYPAESLRIEFLVLPESPALEIQVAIDESTFAQFGALYARYGWRVIDALYRESARRERPYSFPARALIEKTALALRRAVEHELAALEGGVASLARTTWRQTSASLRQWRREFKPLTKARYALADPDKSRKLLGLFETYHAADRKRAVIADKRATVDKAGRYRPGKNDDEYRNFYDAFGKDELALQAEMEKTARDIYAVFPPALFALLTSESRVANDTTHFHGIELARTYGEVDLSTAIHDSIESAIRELDATISSLDHTGAARSIADAATPDVYDPHAAVARRALDTWSFADSFRKMVLGGTPPVVAAYNFFRNEKLNTVLASMQMLDAYLDKARVLRPQAFGRFVATHYRHELEHQESIDANQKAFIGKVTRVFRFVAAVVALLAIIALVVASDGAAASSIAVWGALIKSVNEGLTLAILAVMALETKGADEAAAKEWSAAVASIRAEDPDTILRVGDALWSAYQLGLEVTKALAMLLLPLALQRVSNAIATQFRIETEADVVGRAMDLQGVADDVDSVVRELPIVIGLVGGAAETQ